MEINIWSDIRCPFCYIGKKKFESALEKFEHKDKIKVTWHSFELDPGLETQPLVNAVEHLAEAKGITKAQAAEMQKHVAQAARGTGIKFDFEKSIIANSFRAHRLIKLAESEGKANEAEEALFKAYFIEGKNIDDPHMLEEIGSSIGLNGKSVLNLLNSDDYTEAVRKDEAQAQSLGIRGVPFFVLNGKYGISGAQAPEVFLQGLNRAWQEYEKEQQPVIITEGAVCATDGNCD